MSNPVTGRTAELMMRAALGNPTATARYEGMCAGNPQSPVLGIAVCYAPTLDVLKRAAAEQKTLIVSREHPYFLHGGIHYAYGTDGLETAMSDDPVVKAKKDLVAANKLMVYRAGTGWDQLRPKAQSTALAQSLGLMPVAANDRARGVVCNTTPTTLGALAQMAAIKLRAPCPRIVGDPKIPVRRIALLAGEADPSPGLAALIADPAIDGVICGAGGTVDEVDGAIGYFQDVVGSGRRIAMLAVGYGPSHDPGVAEMARWLKGVFADYAVDYWQTHFPSWIPR